MSILYHELELRGCQHVRLSTLFLIFWGMQKITLSGLLAAILNEDSQEEFGYYHAAFYAGNKSSFTSLLDLIWRNDKGSCIMKKWMKSHAIDLMCDIIHNEMDKAKPALQMRTADATPDFISNWDINKIMEPIALSTTCVWSQIFDAATETAESKAAVKVLGSRNC